MLCYRRVSEGHAVDAELNHAHAYTYAPIQYTKYLCAHFNNPSNLGEMEEGTLKVPHSVSQTLSEQMNNFYSFLVPASASNLRFSGVQKNKSVSELFNFMRRK